MNFYYVTLVERMPDSSTRQAPALKFRTPEDAADAARALGKIIFMMPGLWELHFGTGFERDTA